MLEIASAQPTADMSVVIATPDRYETIRKTIGYLRAQESRARLEIVIVAPSAAGLSLKSEDLAGFARVNVVEVGPIASLARANAAGIRAASAPIVVLAEDHCFPEPGWAEALLQAHEQPYAVVGPVVRNAVPQGTINRADFLLCFSEWLDGTPGGISYHLPGHNSSYKRALLLSYGPDLEAMLDAESVLQWDLRGKGYQLYQEPRARVAHMGFSRLKPWFSVLFHSGRLFGATRSRSWPISRRFQYAAASPLIPFLRFWRIVRRRRYGHLTLTPGVVAALFYGLCASALGEMLGYATGKGAAAKKMWVFDFHRYRYLARSA